MLGIEERLNKLEERVARLEGMEAVPKKTGKVVAPREFLNLHKANSDVENVLLFGFYLETYSGLDSFNVDDLRKIFYLSKVKPPLNTNDKINLNIKKGYMMEALEKKDNKKAWILTGNGEDAVKGLEK